MKEYLHYKYWFSFSGRIGRVEFAFKWITLTLFINLYMLIIHFIGKEYSQYFYLPLMLLLYPLIFSVIKTRYNDLPKIKFGIFFWWWRCLFTKGDEFHNKNGAPSQQFSQKIFYGSIGVYFILVYLNNYLGIK